MSEFEGSVDMWVSVSATYFGHFSEIYKTISIVCVDSNLQWVDHVEVSANVGQTGGDHTVWGTITWNEPQTILTRAHFVFSTDSEVIL